MRIKTIILATLLSSFPMLALAQQSAPRPLGFEPELIVYEDGTPVGIKLAPHVVKTLDECMDVLKPVVADLTSKGLQVNGACVPIPPLPKGPDLSKPADKV